VESPAVHDDGECFSPILLNAAFLNVEVYYNKAVSYTLMVTFVSSVAIFLCWFYLYWSVQSVDSLTRVW